VERPDSGYQVRALAVLVGMVNGMRILGSLLLALGGLVVVINLSTSTPKPQPVIERASAGTVCKLGTSCR
jgi:hypothetical protein